jgi:hypothetical protein
MGGLDLTPGSPLSVKKGCMQAKPSRFIIDKILPRYEISLLGGPSGAGKTRWLMRLLTSWNAGTDVFGHLCYPIPWVYVAADRGKQSVVDTFDTMDIDILKFPVLWAWDEGWKWCEILEQLKKRTEPLVIVESFGSFADPPANGRQVKDFLNTTSRNIRDKQTILGIMESPKMKPYERYENPRQRISGAAAWSHFTETIIVVEQLPKEPDSSSRNLYICPRNAPTEHHSMIFDPGGDLVVNPVPVEYQKS